MVQTVVNHMTIGKTPEDGQNYFVDSIKAWAEKEKLDKFNLFGKHAILMKYETANMQI